VSSVIYRLTNRELCDVDRKAQDEDDVFAKNTTETIRRTAPWSMEKEDRKGPPPTCIPLIPPAEHSRPHSFAADMDLWF
jgi:hypothetical protein